MCVFLVGDGVLLLKASGSRFGKECCRRWLARLKGDGEEAPRSSSEKPLWYSDKGESDGRGAFKPCCGCFWLGWNGEPGAGERLSSCSRGEAYPLSGIATCGCEARAGTEGEDEPGLSLSMMS